MLILALALVRWYRRTQPGDPVSRVSTYDWVRQLPLGGTQGTAVAFVAYIVFFHVFKPR
ncbi:hypothetical protein [Kibdelosporangium phytohabitans]|uniref:hypothetical protein n=1 Tax=Kibdelosporangium phytohabitans TaxID=860235 RepID=UPI001A109450|nr:hypothetical protein [Kibdelosporangium phytohabitans]MBE1462553.1 hypothetical protein [Kibdelosporangium phytohabitans]